jgi:hypothetical protein
MWGRGGDLLLSATTVVVKLVLFSTDMDLSLIPFTCHSLCVKGFSCIKGSEKSNSKMTLLTDSLIRHVPFQC